MSSYKSPNIESNNQKGNVASSLNSAVNEKQAIASMNRC